MKKKKRYFLFTLAIALFLVLAPIVVLFAVGYQYDFTQYKFVKIGSFRIKANTSAHVFINGKFIGSTAFLTNTYSKGYVLPRVYTVDLETPRFTPWSKQLQVDAGYFVEVPKVVLLPQPIPAVVIASPSFQSIVSSSFDTQSHTFKTISHAVGRNGKNGFQLSIFDLPSGRLASSAFLPTYQVSSPPSRHAAIVSPDGDKEMIFDSRHISVGWLSDSGYQPFKVAGDVEQIAGFSLPILDVQWYRDSAHLIANVGGTLKFIELDGRGGRNIYDIGPVTGEFWYDADYGNLYTIQGKNIVKLTF